MARFYKACPPNNPGFPMAMIYAKSEAQAKQKMIEILFTIEPAEPKDLFTFSFGTAHIHDATGTLTDQDLKVAENQSALASTPPKLGALPASTIVAGSDAEAEQAFAAGGHPVPLASPKPLPNHDLPFMPVVDVLEDDFPI